jgi:hypothetical protein
MHMGASVIQQSGQRIGQRFWQASALHHNGSHEAAQAFHTNSTLHACPFRHVLLAMVNG